MAQRGVNKVIIVGNIGKDPEARQLQNGGSVCSITVATSEVWKDKQTGQQQERTEWHRIVFFNKLAEIASQYLRKGSKVYVEGSLITRKWQDQSGQDRYTTEILGSELQMLDNRQSGGQQNQMQQSQQGYQQAPQQPPQQHQGQNAYQQQSQGMNQQMPPQAPAGGFDDFDEDIPF